MANIKKSNTRKPLVIMFAMGTDDHEILRCLEKTRNKLILSKEKIQNLPKNKNAALELISSFNPKSILIITDWFKNNIDFAKLPPHSKSITILKNTPNNQLESEEFKTEWRSIFSAYCDVKTNEKINDFLKSLDVTIATNSKVKLATENIVKELKVNKKSELSISEDTVQNYLKNL